MVPEIITTFSLQVDAAKKMKCDQIHTFVNMMVNIGIQLAQLVLMGFLGPELIPLSVEARVAMAELPALQTALKTAVEESVIQSTQTRIDALKKILDKALSDKGKLSWMTTYGPLDQRVKDTGNARNFAWSNVLLYNFAFYEMAAYTDLKKVYNFKNMAIGPGISHGTICTGFEGDFVDNNAGNRDNLAARLSSVFESGRKQRQALFKALYRGFVTNAGEQSGTAMWLTTRNWEGPSSVLEDMRDISKMEEFVPSYPPFFRTRLINLQRYQDGSSQESDHRHPHHRLQLHQVRLPRRRCLALSKGFDGNQRQRPLRLLSPC